MAQLVKSPLQIRKPRFVEKAASKIQIQWVGLQTHVLFLFLIFKIYFLLFFVILAVFCYAFCYFVLLFILKTVKFNILVFLVPDLCS